MQDLKMWDLRWDLAFEATHLPPDALPVQVEQEEGTVDCCY